MAEDTGTDNNVIAFPGTTSQLIDHIIEEGSFHASCEEVRQDEAAEFVLSALLGLATEDDFNDANIILLKVFKRLAARELTAKADRILGPRRSPGEAA